MVDYPLKHVSIRVPWHDAAWNGTVCNAPHLNGACAKLKRIATSKDDQAEMSIAGKRLVDLHLTQWPPCVDESASFMSPAELTHMKAHPFASQEDYRHLRPTHQRFPAFSAGVTPFRWLMRERIDHLRDQVDLNVDMSREPDLNYPTNWWHEGDNQESLLDGFARHLQPSESLCLFYAKHLPFVEGTARVLIGVGRISGIGQLTEYDRTGAGMRGMVWERPVQHTIRPSGRDGFLMPYHEIYDRYSEDPTLAVEEYAAHAPSEHWDEFSYGGELVSHDAAISAILSIDGTLKRIETELGITTFPNRQWLHDELVRLWKVRGPFPGMGAVLRAFGLSRGLFVAHALQERAGENADPWPFVDAAFRDPSAFLPQELQRDLRELATTWFGLSEERRHILQLLSRFELTITQARHLYDKDTRSRRGWVAEDHDLIENPYRIYEVSRYDVEGVPLSTVDRGVFPEQVVRSSHPLNPPSHLDSAVDPRRVRAFTVRALEVSADSGHTLDFPGSLAEQIRELSGRPECSVTPDILRANVPDMEPEVVVVGSGGETALQLDRYRTIGGLVRRQVLGRVRGTRHSIQANWDQLVADKFDPARDATERRAQKEKAAALAELAESRFSVLAGPAGAGKTSVLGVLCSQLEDEGLLLLAPTGRARVRMQELAGGSGISALTVAQFLIRARRYDARSGRYHLSSSQKYSGYGTVIVDEASMLTEDMLGALFDALQGVNRFILVGDHAQLPPIGAGRPFFDIIAELRPEDYETRFPRVAPGYAELTVERRQVGTERRDLQLARWFGAAPPTPGEDDIFSGTDDQHSRIRFVGWENPDDFQTKLEELLTEELRLSGDEEVRRFNESLGATKAGDYDYFNREKAVDKVTAWQILSPLRGMPFGVGDINRQIHERFRAGYLELAKRSRYRKIPKPMGAERIVYGDKVINIRNHRRDSAYPDSGSALKYIANGEIGIAVGQWRTKGMKRAPWTLKVEFASQRGYTYDFSQRDFTDEGEAALELAYALTVHKAQGSQFKLVIFVLPEGHPILTRELVYTALTRHEDRIVVMHQGPRSGLRDLSSPYASETLRRRTNLLADCRMVEVEIPNTQRSVFLESGLIHRTSRGHVVRSKSELLIAEALLEAGVEFEYEKRLTLGGVSRYPDFTIEDDISGRKIYWEHLGMLDNQSYRAKWEQKLAWYRENGLELYDEDNQAPSVLVTTTDSSSQGLNMAEIKELIGSVCFA